MGEARTADAASHTRVPSCCRLPSAPPARRGQQQQQQQQQWRAGLGARAAAAHALAAHQRADGQLQDDALSAVPSWLQENGGGEWRLAGWVLVEMACRAAGRAGDAAGCKPGGAAGRRLPPSTVGMGPRMPAWPPLRLCVLPSAAAPCSPPRSRATTTARTNLCVPPPVILCSTASCVRVTTRTSGTPASSSTACGTSWRRLSPGAGRCRCPPVVIARHCAQPRMLLCCCVLACAGVALGSAEAVAVLANGAMAVLRAAAGACVRRARQHNSSLPAALAACGPLPDRTTRRRTPCSPALLRLCCYSAVCHALPPSHPHRMCRRRSPCLPAMRRCVPTSACLPSFPPPAHAPVQDVEAADAFFASHMAPGHTPFPYPRDLFLKFITENDGG